MDLNETECADVNWIYLSPVVVSCEHNNSMEYSSLWEVGHSAS